LLARAIALPVFGKLLCKRSEWVFQNCKVFEQKVIGTEICGNKETTVKAIQEIGFKNTN